MPSYSYTCEVCSSHVAEGNESCPVCGCPAEKSLKELNWHKEKWEASDKSKPVAAFEEEHKKRIPFCVFTSIGILLTVAWHFLIYPDSGNIGNLVYTLIASSIAFPLGIIGLINGVIHLRKKNERTATLATVCFSFSVITIFVTALPAYFAISLFLKRLL